MLQKEKEDAHKQTNNLRLNFKQVKRNIAAQIRLEEKKKYEKDAEEMMKYFKAETQQILKEFNNQRHELMRRTTNIDNLGRFLIHQEMYISGIAKLLADNFQLSKIHRTDKDKNTEVDKLLEEGGADPKGVKQRGHSPRAPRKVTAKSVLFPSQSLRPSGTLLHPARKERKSEPVQGKFG